MAVQLHHEDGSSLLEVRIAGRLTAEDYKLFVPAVDALVKQHGKISILVIMEDFHGWSPKAMWEDLKFALKNFTHIKRLAFVGQKRWQHGMVAACRPFTAARMRYFDKTREHEARQWLAEEPSLAGSAR